MGFISLKSSVKKALFRLDSGDNYGLGHIMRSMALADTLAKKKFKPENDPIEIACTFAVKIIHANEAVNPHHLIFIESEEDFLSLAKSYDIVIVDHYEYTTELFFQLSQFERSILVILDDECNRGNLYADIVINPATKALSLPYKEVAPGAKLLIGLKYILLRTMFQQFDCQFMQQHPYEQRDSIVVTFGGSDVTGITLPVMKAIYETSLMEFNIIVVTGAGCKNKNDIVSYCHQYGYNHQHNVQNMARLLSNARLAISAAGSTLFELAYCGVPSVFVVVADNQYLSVKEHSQYGWCEVVDCRERNKPDELVYCAEKMLNTMPLEKMSRIARTHIDGQGAHRVASIIKGE